MKVVYIDGYNLAHQLGIKISSSSLNEARDKTDLAAVDFLRSHNEFKNSFRVISIYDGKGLIGTEEISIGVKRIFTVSGETADARIKKMIDEFPSKKKLTVISSDREVMNYAKLYGINTIRSQVVAAKFQNRFVSIAQSKTPAEKHKDHSSNLASELTMKELQEWKAIFGIGKE
ncbi:MAG: NYN domain-containing protein [Chloroherpetonaceae bacterium]|nr:NYN domain-containing protein [Chloroherpetonaceae bacterium]